MMELVPVTLFVKGKRIQRLSHIIRRGDSETVRTAFPQGKRSRGTIKEKIG